MNTSMETINSLLDKINANLHAAILGGHKEAALMLTDTLVCEMKRMLSDLIASGTNLSTMVQLQAEMIKRLKGED